MKEEKAVAAARQAFFLMSVKWDESSDLVFSRDGRKN